MPSGQVQVDDGLGAVDASLTTGVMSPGGTLDELDQVLIGIGDGVDPLLGAIGALDPHGVEAVDVDVLDVVLVEEELQTTQSQLGGDEAADDLLLFVCGRGGARALHHGARRLVDGLSGELLHEGTALAFAHTGRAVADDPISDVRRRVLLQLATLLGIHRRASDLVPAPTTASSFADWSEGNPPISASGAGGSSMASCRVFSPSSVRWWANHRYRALRSPPRPT